jgi:predicted nucleic acid-binding protein
MTLVTDASVALKWVIPEAESERARALRAGDADLIAPTLITAEIGNVLWKKTMRKEIGREEAVSALRLALSHFAEFIPLDNLREIALELAIELRHPIYDCFYLALAQRERCALVTADRRLLSAAETLAGIELRAL